MCHENRRFKVICTHHPVQRCFNLNQRNNVSVFINNSMAHCMSNGQLDKLANNLSFSISLSPAELLLYEDK